MTRIALPAAILVTTFVAACASSPSPQRTATTVPFGNVATREIPYTPGSGVVQSVTPAPSASAGGTASPEGGAAAKPRAATGPERYRLAIRMEGGRTQYVDMMGPDVPAVGSRVRLTPDHQIVRE